QRARSGTHCEPPHQRGGYWWRDRCEDTHAPTVLVLETRQKEVAHRAEVCFVGKLHRLAEPLLERCSFELWAAQVSVEPQLESRSKRTQLVHRDSDHPHLSAPMDILRQPAGQPGLAGAAGRADDHGTRAAA